MLNKVRGLLRKASKRNGEAEESLALAQRALGLQRDYMQAPSPQKVAHLQRAIQFYEMALTGLTQPDFPTHWATTQNNLGAAYDDLPTGDRAENLSHAIACYQAALHIYTERDFPIDWAMTQ